jgi:mono/diheme cytochrome c family protein
MRKHWANLSAAVSFLSIATLSLLLSTGAAAQDKSAAPSVSAVKLRAARSSTADLELGGELAGVPSDTTRFMTRDDLLALPQVSYTVSDDLNFKGSVQVSGVLLGELARQLAAAPMSALVVAICDDQFRGHYSRDYIAAHQPLLVLKINGQPPSGWPKNAQGHGSDMGPYLISHPRFMPSFKFLAHSDEAQIPWGVLRLEFRDEMALFGALAPRGPHAPEPAVQAGYRIAQQSCLQCHNMGRDGGLKAGRPWLVLSAWAASSPEYFAAYVRNPKTKNPHADMPGNPGYDDATISALRAYFQTFSPQEKP